MTFDKFCFWCCLFITTAFISANAWLVFKALNAMPQAIGTYAVTLVVCAAIAYFKPETRLSILGLATALITGIPAAS